ncbi:MAG: SdpI family protein [bacterium]|nr:SdpI family protein [bacterium]
MSKSDIVVIALVVVSFLISFYFMSQVPEEMASHWNAAGEVDGYTSKFWGLFLMPIIVVAIALLFLAIPKIDPLKANIKKFSSYYYRFIYMFLIFMIAVQLQGLLWNVGVEINTNIFFSIGIGLLFFYIGIMLKHIKRNWFIGIRTPWTLSSDKVWDKTHKEGSKWFKVAGIIAFFGALFEAYAIYLIIVPIFAAAIYTVVYSYLLFKKK